MPFSHLIISIWVFLNLTLLANLNLCHCLTMCFLSLSSSTFALISLLDWFFFFSIALTLPLPSYCTHHLLQTILAWQGTDLMHNHILSDDDLSSLDSSARRSSLSRLEPADLSEDSDYDSIWLAHSYRAGSTTRKSCCSYISHQN